ncbi:MAG: hypothetical protein AAGD28_23770 [Bacteroidota bacterium]
MSRNLKTKDIKVFAPAKDFKQSLSFYQELGWNCNWQNEGLAELELGNARFFLQKYYQKDWANNFMFYIPVEDVQAWYEHVSEVLEKGDYGSAKVKAPEKQAHGDIVCIVWDPAGILLHFAQAG